MTYKQYIKKYIDHYRIKDLTAFQRCSGKNLQHKKILIYVLRKKFRLSFPTIAHIFGNHHTTIMFHVEDMSVNPFVDEKVDEAWELYDGEEPSQSGNDQIEKAMETRG